MKASWKDREPGFFTGLYASDFMAIGIAFMFSLGGLYLLWRMLFGPALFEPAIQAQIKTINAMDAKNAPAFIPNLMSIPAPAKSVSR